MMENSPPWSHLQSPFLMALWLLWTRMMLNGTIIGLSAYHSLGYISLCCVQIYFPCHFPKKIQKKSYFGKFLKNFPSFSFPELDLGKLLTKSRKTRNGRRQYNDKNNNDNGLLHLQSEPQSLQHVGKSLRYG